MSTPKKRLRIAVGGIELETNSWIPQMTKLDDFIILLDNAITEKHQGLRTYIGGMLDAADKCDFDIIPTLHADVPAKCGGIIEKETYQYLKEQLLSRIREALPLDAVCLALHGAGMAEGSNDIEQDILDSVREIVGEKVVIGATFDLHGNVTADALKNCDLPYCLKFAPHTDTYDRGYEAVLSINKMLGGELIPYKRLLKLPLLMTPVTTNFGPANTILNMCLESESEPNVIECACFHGFPYDDVPFLGTAVLVLTNNDQNTADVIAEHIGTWIMDHRDYLLPTILSPSEGIEKAKELNTATHKPVVIADSADNPGGGGPGNSTHLLKAMLDSKLSKACFAVIKDSAAVDKAVSAGIGSTITLSIGGNMDALHGAPVEVTGIVKCITDGKFTIKSDQNKGDSIDLGATALLRIDGLDLIIAKERYQPFDDEIFSIHGIDCTEYDIIALKSTNHWRAGFPYITNSVIVDSPGVMSMDIASFPWKNISHPVWPFDKV